MKLSGQETREGSVCVGGSLAAGLFSVVAYLVKEKFPRRGTPSMHVGNQNQSRAHTRNPSVPPTEQSALDAKRYVHLPHTHIVFINLVSSANKLECWKSGRHCSALKI